MQQPGIGIKSSRNEVHRINNDNNRITELVRKESDGGVAAGGEHPRLRRVELAVEGAEGLFSGDPGPVASQDLHRHDQRILHEVVVNHSVTHDRRSVVRARGEQRIARVKPDLSGNFVWKSMNERMNE